MYAGAARASLVDGEYDSATPSHGELLTQITGHLVAEDFAYFQQWDRLLDFEADNGVSSAAESWLIGSEEREKATSKCISNLTFDAASSGRDDSGSDPRRLVLISFQRRIDSGRTPLSNLGLEKGCHAIVSTDATSFGLDATGRRSKAIRPQMHIVRGFMERATDTHIFIRASIDDLSRVQKILAKAGAAGVSFRVDRDEVATGVGTLRQNLVNLFTKVLPDEPERLAWLRNAIVRLRAPQFDDSLKSKLFSPGLGGHSAMPSVPGCNMTALHEEYLGLNQDQKAAVEKVSLN